MTGRRTHTYVVRDTGIGVAFWIVVAVGLVIIVDAVFRGDPWKIAATVSIVALVLWALGMVLFRPNVRYSETGVVVTNIGRIHELPWSRIASVRQALNLTFELDDGRRIQATGVTAPRDRGIIAGTLTRGKLGAGSADFHRNADALRLLQERAVSSTAPAVSRWDIRALGLGALLALAVVAVIVASIPG